MKRPGFSVEGLEARARSIRKTVLRMCRARGGYAGQGIALAELGACVYFSEMRQDSTGAFHDRYVLSNGHDAIVTYAALHELGLYSIDELLTYGAPGSRIEMSPCEQAVPGFEMTAGSLGEGPSQSAGIAYGEKLRGSDRRVYCLLSDGELQEGNVWEGVMFAAHHGLDNLVLLIDNNDMQASGSTSDVLGVEPVPEKFRAFGFEAKRVNGNDVREILDALELARQTKGRPFALIADTRLFHGTPTLRAKYPKAHFLRAPAEEIDAAIAQLDAEAATAEVAV